MSDEFDERNAISTPSAEASQIVSGTTIVHANALLHSLTAEASRLRADLAVVTTERDELRSLEPTVREQATLIYALKAEAERLRGELKWATAERDALRVSEQTAREHAQLLALELIRLTLPASETQKKGGV